MKKVIPVVIFILLVAVVLIFTMPESKVYVMGVKLIYKLVPGSVSKYKARSTMSMKMEIPNLPQPVARSITLRDVMTNMEQIITVEVQKVEGGIATISRTNEVSKMDVTIGGIATKSPSDIVGKKSVITLKQSTTGEVLSVETGIGSPAMGEQVKNNLMMMQEQICFPDTMIKPGYTWDRDFICTMGLGYMLASLKTKVRYKFEKIEKQKGTRCAFITFSGDLCNNPEESGTEKKARDPARINGKMKGKIYFDIKEGEITAIANEVSLEMKTDIRNLLPQTEETGKDIIGKIVIIVETERMESGNYTKFRLK